MIHPFGGARRISAINRPSTLSTMYIGRLRSWWNSTDTIPMVTWTMKSSLVGDPCDGFLESLHTWIPPVKPKLALTTDFFLLQAKHWIPTTPAPPTEKKSIMSLLLEVNLWLKKKSGSTNSPRNSFPVPSTKTDSFIEPCQLVEIFCFAEKKHPIFWRDVWVSPGST